VESVSGTGNRRGEEVEPRCRRTRGWPSVSVNLGIAEGRGPEPARVTEVSRAAVPSGALGRGPEPTGVTGVSRAAVPSGALGLCGARAVVPSCAAMGGGATGGETDASGAELATASKAVPLSSPAPLPPAAGKSAANSANSEFQIGPKVGTFLPPLWTSEGSRPLDEVLPRDIENWKLGYSIAIYLPKWSPAP
jgi:hypothetical protein